MLPLLRIDRIEPAEPTDKIEPADPIDRIEPADPIDKIEPTLATERIEPTEAADCNDPVLKTLSRLAKESGARSVNDCNGIAPAHTLGASCASSVRDTPTSVGV